MRDAARTTELLVWLDDPSPTTGVGLLGPDGWERTTYEELAARAVATAGQLVEAGVAPGAVVAIALPTGVEFLAAFFGTLVAGATPCPLPLGSVTQGADEYVERLADIVAVARPGVCYVDERSRPCVEEALARIGTTPAVLAGPPAEGRGSLAHPDRRPPEVALVQFTSGSTGPPRGVELSGASLAANIAMVRRWLRMGADDRTASWLPLYHDMGLTGCVLTPIVNQSDVMLMRPEQFVRKPLEWLRCFGQHGATLTAAPNFTLDLLLRARRRIDGDDLADFDFSEWRAFIVGAERLDARAMAEVAAWLGPHGFSPEAFLPAYGLAEATLAVTGKPLRSPSRAVRVGWEALEVGAAAPALDGAEIRDAPERFEGGVWLVGCGTPHPGVKVRVVDEAGRDLPPGSLGQIVVAGPTAALRYRVDASAADFHGVVETGDVGFCLDGDLFVVGRVDDCVELGGRRVYLEDLEVALAELVGVPRGRLLCLADPDESGAAFVTVLLEGRASQRRDEAEAALRAALGPAVGVQSLALPVGGIARTTSGKPRRAHMRAQLSPSTVGRANDATEGGA